MRHTMLALAAVALLAATVSCAGPASGGTSDEGWDLSGVIAAVDAGASVTRVTVELAGGAAEPGRAVLLVAPGTEVVVQRADGTTARGGAADLAVGARVQARHTGAELRSLPPQYHASHVRVVARP